MWNRHAYIQLPRYAQRRCTGAIVHRSLQEKLKNLISLQSLSLAFGYEEFSSEACRQSCHLIAKPSIAEFVKRGDASGAWISSLKRHPYACPSGTYRWLGLGILLCSIARACVTEIMSPSCCSRQLLVFPAY
jgi:hypothetical protein